MGSNDLLLVCISAFASVFALLTLLALVMRLIIVVFPQRVATSDTALIAAITSVATALNPGKRVTKVEEVK